MVLSDVKEEVTSEVNGDIQKTERNREMLFIRGDGVVMVSPPLRTN